ncbi:hypothetical protein [Mycobacterium canetti]|uniref:hypothetical protein n=1 Tax=Mycobacterium canetti TaxID=78331 RepID=UPI0002DEA777|nr:hypothetical protein [Mycobacterium canetti]
MTTLDRSDERQRLESAKSVADLIARSVSELVPLTVAETLPGFGAAAVPAGWHLAAPGDTVEQPVRVAVTGHRSRGGWEGCDTLAAFGFTGIAPIDVVVAHAACTLGDLDAGGVTTRVLDIPVATGGCGVRSAGYFTAAGLRIWGQFTTYVAGSERPGTGRLVQHTLFVVTRRRTQLRSDIAYLSDTVTDAFCALLDAPPLTQ